MSEMVQGNEKMKNIKPGMAQILQRSRSVVGQRVMAGPKTVCIAIILFAATALMTKGSLITLVINGLFLMMMAGRAMQAERLGLCPMEDSAEDLKHQYETLQTLKDQIIGATPRRAPIYRDRAKGLWEAIAAGDIPFTDPVMEAKWRQYTEQEDFGEEEILDTAGDIMRRRHLMMVQNVPRELTQMGFLGTVLGLIYAMGMLASGGLSFEKIEESFVTTFSGVGLALLTSGYGLILSLQFQNDTRKVCHRLTQNADAVTDLLTGIYAGGKDDPVLKEMARSRREVAAIRNAVTGSLGSSMGEQISAQIAASLDSLVQVLTDREAAFKLEEYEALERIVREFLAKMTAGMDSHIDHLGSSVDKLSLSQAAMTKQLRAFLTSLTTALANVQGVNTDTDKLLQDFSGYLAKIDQMAGSTEQTMTAISDYSGQIAAASEGQKSIAEGMAGQQEQINAACTSAAELMAQVLEAQKGLRDVCGQMSAAGLEMKNAANAMLQLTQNGGMSQAESRRDAGFSGGDEVQESLNRLVMAMEKTNRQLEEMQNSGIRGLIRQLRELWDRRNGGVYGD